MPGTITFRIRGALELQKLLTELGPRPASKAGDRALREAAKPIVAEAKRLVRVRSGALKRAIVYAPISGSGRRKGEKHGYIGFRRPLSRRAHFTEFGTARSRAFPFMRPAMDSKSAEFIEILSEALARAIEREAISLSKKIK